MRNRVLVGIFAVAVVCAAARMKAQNAEGRNVNA